MDKKQLLERLLCEIIFFPGIRVGNLTEGGDFFPTPTESWICKPVCPYICIENLLEKRNRQEINKLWQIRRQALITETIDL